jgi:glycosyltransferase involved in cell wall biosynthesis
MAVIYGLDPASIPIIYPAPPLWENEGSEHAAGEAAWRRNDAESAGRVASLDDRDARLRSSREHLLVVSPLTRYKRDDLAILAATRLGAPLTVVGDGPERARLERLAGPSVAFLGHVPDRELSGLYRRASGLVFCAEEDFGLVPVEAMREGCPVLALRAGGATETVQEGIGGLFFDEPTVDSVMAGVTRLSARSWDPASVRASVARFSASAFEREIREWVARASGLSLPARGR